ncbi:MAG: hypothetical protein DIZ80_01100 [endosymbiont of Galathealinum brachiosum]|uniref:GGDEF domain-containing protein n=1 Tax=endosymbiont of Galathealinum brachiosum TaxID=2200906 RepID=A0A370DPN8_9GAMM|nr:MAG: hypothetical protein DIZ80_01100 [endosymbiont of Galathealinum brachiosum]
MYMEMTKTPGFLKEFAVPFTIKNLSLIVIFSLLFFLMGVSGLQLQSAQTGVSSIWPASGLTFACLLIFGFRLWPGVLAGMLLLGFYTGLPFQVAIISGIAAILETVIPLSIARKFGFTGRLDSLHEALIFATIVTLGPIISALIGSTSMYFFSEAATLPSLSVMMLWWLGNSIGILLFGGMILSICTGVSNGLFFNHFWEKISLILAALLICTLAFLQSSGIESTLFIKFIIPLTMIGAIRFGSFGAFSSPLIATIVLLSISSNLPDNLFEHAPFGYLYLILVELWFVSISGLIMAGAFHDRSSQSQMKWLAHHDTLTQLANRNVLEQETIHALQGMRRMDQGLCLLFIDLDQLKSVNDQLGHKEGDRLLVSTAKLLVKQVRSRDIVARWGGDEFIILLRNCDLVEAQHIAEKIIISVHELSSLFKGKKFKISMSIGVTNALKDDSHESLIERADKACYTAKNTGKDKVIVI